MRSIGIQIGSHEKGDISVGNVSGRNEDAQVSQREREIEIFQIVHLPHVQVSEMVNNGLPVVDVFYFECFRVISFQYLSGQHRVVDVCLQKHIVEIHHVHIGDAVDEVDGPAFEEVPLFTVLHWIVNDDLVSEIVGVA